MERKMRKPGVLVDRLLAKTHRPAGPEPLGAQDMADTIGRAVGRSARVAPTPVTPSTKLASPIGTFV
jgi:uncharacterized protein YbjT (DUF2867 family)